MVERQHTTGKAKRVDVVVGKARSKGAKHTDVGVGRTVGHLPAVSDKSLKRDVERGELVRVGSLIADSKPREVEYPEQDFEIIFDLLGGSQTLGSAIKSDMDAHELLNQGLPKAALSSLVDKLRVIEVSEASVALGMSLRTFQRHKSTPVELLDVQQSGRAWKFAEILAKATRVLGSQEDAEHWLGRPAIGLDQQRPIDLLTTPAGVKLVEDYLGRLEYNVYT
jgi:putative toxin-antitoxin system antitoxin component (TIGR02293 family)